MSRRQGVSIALTRESSGGGAGRGKGARTLAREVWLLTVNLLSSCWSGSRRKKGGSKVSLPSVTEEQQEKKRSRHAPFAAAR